MLVDLRSVMIIAGMRIAVRTTDAMIDILHAVIDPARAPVLTAVPGTRDAVNVATLDPVLANLFTCHPSIWHSSCQGIKIKVVKSYVLFIKYTPARIARALGTCKTDQDLLCSCSFKLVSAFLRRFKYFTPTSCSIAPTIAHMFGLIVTSVARIDDIMQQVRMAIINANTDLTRPEIIPFVPCCCLVLTAADRCCC